MPEPRVDRDLVSRFATCCRALGLSVHDRKRPADLTAARSGFAALTHVAHDGELLTSLRWPVETRALTQT